MTTKASISILELVRFSLGGKVLGKIVKFLFYSSLMFVCLPYHSFLPSQPTRRTIYRMSDVDQWVSPVEEGEGSPHHFSWLGVLPIFFWYSDTDDQHTYFHVNFFPPIKSDEMDFFFTIFEYCSQKEGIWTLHWHRTPKLEMY